MSKLTVKELKALEKQLIDEIVLNPDKMESIIKIQLQKREGFHNYTFNNIILASGQLYQRKEETAELLAPFKKWGEVNRHVKKGEKALYILAPIFFKEEKDDGTIEKKMWFKKVPVFDLSQTEGEPMEESMVVNHGLITFEDIMKINTLKVNESDKEITRGYTDGKEIWISKHIPNEQKICVYFHELAHYKLHFDNDRYELKSSTKEMEAEAVSYMISKYLGIENEESAAYIWSHNQNEDIKMKMENRGSKILKCVTDIIKEMKLDELLEMKQGVELVNECGNEVVVEMN